MEVCFDGVDNDCDGLVDEGVPETCNGLDDDCDGRVDNGVRRVASSGVCVTEPGFSCTLTGLAAPSGSGGMVLALLVALSFPGALRRHRRSSDSR